MHTGNINADAFLLVPEGTVIFIADEEEFQLAKGDMFTFKSTKKHSIKALQDASLLIVK